LSCSVSGIPGLKDIGDQPMLVLPEGHANRRPFWRMSQRILDKVDEELCQELSVSANVKTHVD
jgi:hypothetical protein